MKTITQLTFIISLIALFTTCGDDNKEIREDTLKLNKSSITVSHERTLESIELIATEKWNAEDIPNWITLSLEFGEKSEKIEIEIKENTSIYKREANIRFVSNSAVKYLRIEQDGFSEDTMLPWLGMFGAEKMTYDKTSDSYSVESKKLFANTNIINKIYLSNLVSQNATPHTDIPQFTGYTFNPTTIFTHQMTVDPIDYTPSLTAHNAYVKTIIDSKPKQSQSWQSDGGSTEFFSYKHLHNIGMINLGIKLDELIAGKPFTQTKMSKKYGFIYTFKHILFMVATDFPYGGDVVKEELKAEDKAKGVSYISSVGYGRVGFLVVETDSDPAKIRVIINKINLNGALSSEEETLLQSCDISNVSFDNNNHVQILKGHRDAVDAYRNGAKDEENIYPVEFEITNCEDFGMEYFKYTYKVPQ